MDVGQDARVGPRHLFEQVRELLIVRDGQVQVALGDFRAAIVPGRVAGQLQDLGLSWKCTAIRAGE